MVLFRKKHYRENMPLESYVCDYVLYQYIIIFIMRLKKANKYLTYLFIWIVCLVIIMDLVLGSKLVFAAFVFKRGTCKIITQCKLVRSRNKQKWVLIIKHICQVLSITSPTQKVYICLCTFCIYTLSIHGKQYVCFLRSDCGKCQTIF